ncbi:hypothetical protein BDW22DRAFT_184625 [Trametopsis cervina]|nr:hypothetical protein BDW22DRAFT_184625 [Trametopsis cervina]
MSDSDRNSSGDSDDESTDHPMYDDYLEEDSLYDRAEVEAALAEVEEEIDETLQVWGAPPDRRILSTITERSETHSSRPVSGAIFGNRPASQSFNNGRSTPVPAIIMPTAHTRSTTEPGARPNTPGRGVSQIIAKFEAKRAVGEAISPFTQGHSRTASAPSGPRSPSPYTLPTSSQTMPTFSTVSRDTGYASSTGYTYSSRSSSPTKSRGGSAVTGPRPPPSGDSRSAASHTHTQSVLSGYSGTYSRTGSIIETFTGLSGTGSLTESTGATPSALSLRRPQSPPRSPITQVTNIVAAWKGKTPVLSKTGRASLTPSPGASENGKRRRSMTPRTVSSRSRRTSDVSSTDGFEQSSANTGAERSHTSAVLPPPFDAAEFGITDEPINVGLLWYLNVHAPLPYRWQRCQAVLYPHMLLLTWIAPGGGRGVVTLDLLNCTEVRTALSPTHPESKDDVGAIAAKEQGYNSRRAGSAMQPGEDGLAEMLSPFHLMYTDGIERLVTANSNPMMLSHIP